MICRENVKVGREYFMLTSYCRIIKYVLCQIIIFTGQSYYLNIIYTMKNLRVSFSLYLILWMILETALAQSFFTKIYYKNDIQSSTIAKTIDASYLVTGNDYGGSNFLLKIDSLGNLIWSKQLIPIHSDNYIDIISLEDSTYLFTTSNYNLNNGYYNLECIVFDNNGDTLWSKEYDFGNSFLPYSATETFDNDLIITGTLYHSDDPKKRIAVAKLNSQGTLSWAKTLAGGDFVNYGYSIKQTPDTNFIITGFIEDSDPFESYAFLTKLTTEGNMLWSKTYHVDSTEYCIGYDVFVEDDGYLIACITSDNLLLMKTNHFGSVSWAKQYDTYSFDFSNSPAVRIRKTNDNDFAILAPDYLIKVDESGDLIWASGMVMYVSDIYESQDDGLMVIGNGPVYGVKAPMTNYQHIGLIKMDKYGYNDAYCVLTDSWVTYEEKIITSQQLTFNTEYVESTTTQTDFQVSDINLIVEDECVTFLGSIKEGNSKNQPLVFPNPSSGIFTIVANSEQINHIAVYNSMGRIILQTSWASQKLVVDISDQSSGVYQIKIQTTGGSTVQKLMIY